MSPEQLMKPRWKMIADFPTSDNGDWYNVGDVLTDPGGRECVRDQWNNPVAAIDFNRYPHLFRKLQWWQERIPEEMPEYVKNENNRVYKVAKHFNDETKSAFDIEGVDDYGRYYRAYLPATEQEYNEYQKSKTP